MVNVEIREVEKFKKFLIGRQSIFVLKGKRKVNICFFSCSSRDLRNNETGVITNFLLGYIKNVKKKSETKHFQIDRNWELSFWF